VARLDIVATVINVGLSRSLLKSANPRLWLSHGKPGRA